jgi:hypothetical protein
MRDDLAESLERAARLHEQRDQLKAALARAQAEAPAPSRGRPVLLLGIALVGLTVPAVMLVVSRGVPAGTWSGEVTEATGATAPAAAGDACTVQLQPGYGVHDGWLTVDCGGRRLVGWDVLGGVSCATSDAGLRTCRDDGPIAEDGDPTMHLDEAAGTVVLTDGPAWSLTIALDGQRRPGTPR